MKLLSCVCVCVFFVEGFGQTCFRNTALYASILKAISYLPVNDLFNSFILAIPNLNITHPQIHAHPLFSWHNIYRHAARHNCSKKFIPGNKCWVTWSQKSLYAQTHYESVSWGTNKPGVREFSLGLGGTRCTGRPRCSLLVQELWEIWMFISLPCSTFRLLFLIYLNTRLQREKLPWQASLIRARQTPLQAQWYDGPVR